MTDVPPGAVRRETTVAVGAVADSLRLAHAGARDAAVTVKDGRDVVTSVDVAVEEAVRDRLSVLGLPCVGEEHGGTPPADGSAYWLIDPICGTRNFASGVPLWCVNVALVEGGEVTAAVVGDPSTGEVAMAERGRGSWALGDGGRRALAVSDASRTVIVEDGKAVGARRAQAARLIGAVVAADRWDLRSLGTSLSLPYLAGGRVSAYVAALIGGVHSAAGTLVAAEAGATLSDLAGRPWSLASDSLVAAATPRLHADLLALAAGEA